MTPFAVIILFTCVVFVKKVRWLSLHYVYYYGYLFKGLKNQNLPIEESELFRVTEAYLLDIFDAKFNVIL